MSDEPVVVIGAGPGGIASALALQDVGLRPLVLDGAAAVASSWRGRYDRLRLNTCRWLSHLPDRRFPKGTPMFPSRDDLIGHLERHAREARLALRLNTRVSRIDEGERDWLVETDVGTVVSDQIVLATGYEQEPVIPDWPGRSTFQGRLLHSSEYRNPAPFADQSVLVVGSGCSGMEIAYDLAASGAGPLWLAVRTPPNIQLREGPKGFPGDIIAVALMHTPIRFADAFANFGRKMDLGDLSEYGLPVPDEGIFARFQRLGVVPSIVDREVIDAIKSGAITVTGGVESFDPTGVHLADGERIEPAAVVAATGYRRGLEPLVGHLGVLDERGVPLAQGAEAPAPGLRFIGYTARPGVLGHMSKQAKRAAKAIADERRTRVLRPASICVER